MPQLAVAPPHPAVAKAFLQEGLDAAEVRQVKALAEKLLDRMNEPGPRAALVAANMPGKSSDGVKDVLAPFLLGLGFEPEKVGLFDDSAARPDFFLKVGRSGILLEVERGKSTINNMDLLDFWKCHLCLHAHYLFLLVPQELRQNDADPPTKPYNAVVRRLAPFFADRRNYTNVRGLWVFGY